MSLIVYRKVERKVYGPTYIRDQQGLYQEKYIETKFRIDGFPSIMSQRDLEDDNSHTLESR